MDGTKRIKLRHGKFISAHEILQGAEEIIKVLKARIGDTPVKRLAWLLRFMNTDLTVLREEEGVALGYDLQSLWLATDLSANTVPPMPISPLLKMDRSELSEIQKWLKDGFTALFSEKPHHWIFPAPAEIHLVRKGPLNAKRSDLGLVTFWPTVPGREGERQSIELAILHIVFEGRDLLRACSECKSPFIPVRRQEYCSVKCSQKARDRRRKK